MQQIMLAVTLGACSLAHFDGFQYFSIDFPFPLVGMSLFTVVSLLLFLYACIIEIKSEERVAVFNVHCVPYSANV